VMGAWGSSANEAGDLARAFGGQILGLTGLTLEVKPLHGAVMVPHHLILEPSRGEIPPARPARNHVAAGKRGP
jgi:hypothetical protein